MYFFRVKVLNCLANIGGGAHLELRGPVAALLLANGKPLSAPAAILDSPPPVPFQFGQRSSRARPHSRGGTALPEPPIEASEIPFGEEFRGKRRQDLRTGHASRRASSNPTPVAVVEYLQWPSTPRW